MKRLIAPLLVLSAVVLQRTILADGTIQAVNQRPESLRILQEAAPSAGMRVAVADAKAGRLTADVLIWEARKGDDSSLTKQRADEIEAFVAKGGDLLVTCGLLTWSELYRLTAVCPTTGWHGMCGRQVEGEERVNQGAAVVRWNTEMFAGLDLSGSEIGYHYSIRPFHQVERGIQRYERYETTWRHLAKEFIFTIGDRNYDLPADHTFWTRPLRNRSWKNEIILDNIDGTALLMTGRCGKGKVAVLATAVSETDGWDNRQEFWTRLLTWLKSREPFEEELPPRVVPSSGERIVASVPGKSGLVLKLLEDRSTRTVGVLLINGSDRDIPAEVVIRVSTWQRSLITDLNAKVIVPARLSKTVRWKLPLPDLTGYQATSELDEYDLRLGVLDHDGGSFLVEETRCRVHLGDPLQVHVFADNLYTVDDYPFVGSAMENSQGNVLQHDARMGHPTHAYAYKPGTPVNCTIEVANGLRNLAPLAKVTDAVDPDNATTCAINDQGGSYNQSYKIGDGVIGYSDWVGTIGEENVLRFDFPEPVNIASITLFGSVKTSGGRQHGEADNPGAVVVEIEGRIVAEATDLDQQFQQEHGRAFIRFDPVKGRLLRLRFPWINRVANSDQARRPPRLADVEVGGSPSDVFPTAINGVASWTAIDALTDRMIAAGEVPVTVGSADRTTVRFEFTAPKLAHQKDMRPVRVEVVLGGATDSLPIMVIDPDGEFFRSRTERLTEYYASKGVRKSFPVGTGTREFLRDPPSVAQPDDQVWCYARHIQDGGEHDARRAFAGNQGIDYIPRGWMEFNNGRPFFDLSVPHLVDQGRRYARETGKTKMAIMLSDHWHAAPQLDQSWAWQHVVAFDRHLRRNGKPGLTGLTHAELKREILEQHEQQWIVWNLDYYLGRLRALRDGFRAAGLELVIHSQNFPVVPTEYAAEVAEVIGECNDDCTWVMFGESEAWTTARQMTQKIYNPYYQWCTLLNWGWVSSMLGSSTWQNPVGTSETSRRKYLNRAWLGCLDFDGNYSPMNEIGFGLNGGHAFNMGTHEWQQWWQLGEQIAFLWPDRPLGPGFVFSNHKFSRDQRPLVGVGEFTLREYPSLNSTIYAWRAFYENGVPTTFGANAKTLANYRFDRPLVLIGISEFSDKETESLMALQQRGIGLVATMGGEELSPALAALFGVDQQGKRTTGTIVGQVLGRDIVRHGKTLFYPLHFDEYSNQRIQRAREDLLDVLDLNIQLPDGVTGYAHYRGEQLFVILEDRLEQGRLLKLRLKSKPGSPKPRACRMVDHRTATVRVEEGWWVIETPTRPGDGTLLCIEGYEE